jgi:hypothetical protein
VTPLAELLWNIVATTYEMYATLVKPENAVVALVARRPDRIINPEVVYAFVGVEDVEFAFLDNSGYCRGCGCPSLPPDSFAGVGRAMMEWVLTPGFLEQVLRNEKARRDTKSRIRGWSVSWCVLGRGASAVAHSVKEIKTLEQRYQCLSTWHWRQALGVVGGLLDPHLALLQGDTQSRRLPPVRCASAGAERREGGLCAGPAYVVGVVVHPVNDWPLQRVSLSLGDHS